MPQVDDAPSVSGQHAGFVISKGPITGSAPLNIGIGATAAGAINGATLKLAQDDSLHNIIAIGLNILMQPAKEFFPILKDYKWAILFMLLVTALVCLFLVHPGDHIKAFRDTVLGVFDALGNYKADKASGLNILKPAED